MHRGAWRATYSPWGHRVGKDWATIINTHTHTHTDGQGEEWMRESFPKCRARVVANKGQRKDSGPVRVGAHFYCSSINGLLLRTWTLIIESIKTLDLVQGYLWQGKSFQNWTKNTHYYCCFFIICTLIEPTLFIKKHIHQTTLVRELDPTCHNWKFVCHNQRSKIPCATTKTQHSQLTFKNKMHVLFPFA